MGIMIMVSVPAAAAVKSNTPMSAVPVRVVLAISNSSDPVPAASNVPSNKVQSIVDNDTSSRLNTLSQQIMSRTNLEKIIIDFGLFAGPQYENVFMEKKIESLRRKISIDITRDRRGADAFSISYQGMEPEKVMKVANGLAAYFIDENLKARESQAFGTSDFLEDE